MEDTVHDTQPLQPIQRLRGYAKPFEIVENVRFDTLQPGFCRSERFRFNTERQVLRLNLPVVSAGKLILKHFRVFSADAVKVIALKRDADAFRPVILGCGLVDERELELDRAVEIVEEIAPAVEDRGLVLVLRKLIVDVLILDRFREIVVRHAADAVRVHALEWDTVLCGKLSFVLSLGFGDCCFNLPFLGSCELPCLRQWRIPPCRENPAVQGRRRSCLSGTAFVWAL